MADKPLLDELREAGQLDSTGTFTLAGEAALGKLRRFQLQRPSHYVLFLIRAAVAGGATRLSWRQRPLGLTLEAEGWEIPQGDPLRGVLLSPDEQPSEYYLGVALNTLRGIPGSTVRTESGDGKSVIRVTHRPSMRRLAQALEEWALLRDREIRPEIPVFDGTQRRPPPELKETIPGSLLRYTGSVCRGVLGPSLNGNYRVRVIKHGVMLRGYPTSPGLGPPFEAWLHADGLRLDLSGNTVVEDDRHRQFEVDVERAQVKLIEHLCRPSLAKEHGAIRYLLIRTLIQRILARRSCQLVPGNPPYPEALGPAPQEILGPPTPAIGMLADAPLFEQYDGGCLSARHLANLTRRGWGPPPASAGFSPSGGTEEALGRQVFVGVKPRACQGKEDAIFLKLSCIIIFEIWPARLGRLK